MSLTGRDSSKGGGSTKWYSTTRVQSNTVSEVRASLRKCPPCTIRPALSKAPNPNPKTSIPTANLRKGRQNTTPETNANPIVQWPQGKDWPRPGMPAASTGR